MKTENGDNPYDGLQRIFHEPHRLAIMSALCAVSGGMSFTELKRECGLTDGNLSRHLKTMEQADVINVEKKFVASKPRTTVYVSELGRESFVVYLQALEEVLHKATESIQEQEERESSATVMQPVSPL
jgi:DNA-binding HxlR family transcriptional regulator